MASSGIRLRPTCPWRRSMSRGASNRSAGASSNWVAKAASPSSPGLPAPASRSPCAFSPGEGGTLERLRSNKSPPLASRMRVRLATERATPDELQEYLRQALHKAGAVKLMTPELIATLCDHAHGNLRALMNMAGELLVYAAEREARQIDEKLFLETCATPPTAGTKVPAGRRR